MERFESLMSIPLPDNWFPKSSLTVMAPDGQANVIASSEPLDESIDTQTYAEVQGDLLRREFPDYRELSVEPFPAFGRRGLIRVFEWHPPDGVPVTQIQMYCAENGRGYTATATTPSTVFDRFESQFRTVLGGIAI